MFLTQITKSPVVVRSTQAGVYALDRQAPARLSRRLQQARAELEAVLGQPAAREAAEVIERGRERQRLVTEVGKLERGLGEAQQSLKVVASGG